MLFFWRTNLKKKKKYFIFDNGKTDAETEAPILWPPDVKSWLIGKDPGAGKDWGQKERRQQRMRRLDGNTDSTAMSWANSGRWWRTDKPMQSMVSQSAGHDWATEQQQLFLTIWVEFSRCFSFVLSIFWSFFSGSFYTANVFTWNWFKMYL